MSGAVSKALARAGAFCCANDTLAKSRTTTSKSNFFDRFIRASKLSSNSFAYETCGVFSITAALIHRDLRVLADEPFSDHHLALVVIEDQLLWRITGLFPLLDNVERIVIEIFCTGGARPVAHPGDHEE